MSRSFYLIISFILTLTAHGQQTNYTKTPALGVHVAFFDFTGADSLRSFGNNMKPGLAINFQNNISKQLEYNITLSGSFLDFTDRKNRSLGDGKKQLLLEADASVRAKLLPPKALVNPFAQLGAGFSLYKNYVGMYIPAGTGCQVNFTPDLFILINSQYRLPITTSQHRHFYYSIGLAGTINRKRINKTKPAPPPPVVIRKPIDSDGDGIVDSVDRCATVIGVIRYHGCPVPDTDKDGIDDEKDKCPNIAGNAATNGCPELKQELKTRVNIAAQHIFFETNKYELLSKSYLALDEVVQILKDNPQLQLLIEGHTDNKGTPDKNQVLSENRARSVLNYLAKSGISISRLQAAGYGQQQPIADNGTSEGRAINRRVEFKLQTGP